MGSSKRSSLRTFAFYMGLGFRVYGLGWDPAWFELSGGEECSGAQVPRDCLHQPSIPKPCGDFTQEP